MGKWIAGAVAVLMASGTAAQAPSGALQIDAGILHTQVILDRLGFGPGVLNGKPGRAFTNALSGFQTSRGLPVTGKLDQPTQQALQRYRGIEATKTLTLDARALAGPYTPYPPKDPAEQAKLKGMYYRSPMEKLAEMFHTTPQVLMALNSPTTRLAVGSKVVFPNALPTSRAYPADIDPTWRQTLASLNVDAAAPQADHIVVSKSKGTLGVYDADDKLLAQFTATMGSAHDPLPLGTWKIQGVARNPDWRMDPTLLRGVDDKKAVQVVPPGPNNPVGVVWIDLSREHYGIHGTPNPEKIGLTESNGCVRLTNWSAEQLAASVKPGVEVIFS